MKVIAVIPARYASTRFPAKLMQDLGGKTVIARTYESAINTNLFDDVFVVTDSDLIFNEIVSQGGKAIMSIKEHESGSDRIAEAVSNLDVDIVINIQGDEPFIDKNSLEKLIQVYKTDSKGEVDLASLMREITAIQDIENPNNVKVVVDQNGFALYFSRSVIPSEARSSSSTKKFPVHSVAGRLKIMYAASANIAGVRPALASIPGIICNAAVSITVRGHNAFTAMPSRLNSSAIPKTHMLMPYLAIV